jgi:hypothetical protein
MTHHKPAPVSTRYRSLDNRFRSERSSGSGVRIGRASVLALAGDAGEAAARAQGEALIAIAKSLGLMDEEEPE